MEEDKLCKSQTKKGLDVLISKRIDFRTMKEQISTLRNWAIKRAKNASNVPVTTKQEEMPILLTRPELELERSFDLNSSKE